MLVLFAVVVVVDFYEIMCFNVLTFKCMYVHVCSSSELLEAHRYIYMMLKKMITHVVLFVLTMVNVQGDNNGEICIVGAGIGGAATAYFSKSRKTRVFEARDYVGGRLKHFVMDDQTIELGGDAWSSANEYVEKIAKDLGINTTTTSHTDNSNNKWLDPVSKSLSVWNGTTLLNGEEILIEHGISDLHGIVDEALFLVRIKGNYMERGETHSFSSIDEFLRYGRLDEYTSISSRDYFTNQHIATATQLDLLEPLMRCIYGQGLNAHAFATLVALTSMVGASSVSSGNSDLVRAMFRSANSSIHLSTKVERIQKSTSSNTLTIETQDNTSYTCQDVVIAAPIEFTNITFENINVTITPPRKFENCTVTVVKAKSVNVSYFNLDDASKVPNNIFTTSKASESTPFTVMQLEAGDLKDGYSIWKFFSVQSVPIHDIFIDIAQVKIQKWPYTFPHLEPNPTFQPIKLAPHVYYLNTMESIASAMEVSIIAGRNIAMLLN